MKRSKQTIINRRIMHRYQQTYRTWHRIINGRPPLRIPNGYSLAWDNDLFMHYIRQGIILLETEGGNDEQ